MRKIGYDKNQAEPAKTKMTLSNVWSLTFSSLYLHENTKKITPPSAMTVPGLTIKGQEVGSGPTPRNPHPFSWNSKNIPPTH